MLQSELFGRKRPTLGVDLPTFNVRMAMKPKPDVIFNFIEHNKLYNAGYPRGYTLAYIMKIMIEPVYNISRPNLLQVSFRTKLWQY